jgi:hypothetical protein
MRRVLRHRPSPGLAVAVIGLLLGLGGTSLAASGGGGSGDEATTSAVRPIPTRGVKHKHLGRNSVDGTNVAPNSLGADDIIELDLGKVKQALNADAASFATRAGTTETATTATTAITATATEVILGEKIIPRTTAPLTAGTGGGEIEGGNLVDLATVGTTHYQLLCRITSGTGVGRGSYNPPAPFVENGETEAKIIVWDSDRELTLRSKIGPRINVPVGQPQYDTTPDSGGTDKVNGEGQHMISNASNDSADEERFYQTRFPGFGTTQGAMVLPVGGPAQIVDIGAGFNALGIVDECFAEGVVREL